jgi:hypothetical protein
MAKDMITEDHIREAAYYLWDNEGRPADKAEEHWYRALQALVPPAPVAACAAEPGPVAKRSRKSAAPRKPASRKAAAAKG